jgi:hypothetical protein
VNSGLNPLGGTEVITFIDDKGHRAHPDRFSCLILTI